MTKDIDTRQEYWTRETTSSHFNSLLGSSGRRYYPGFHICADVYDLIQFIAEYKSAHPEDSTVFPIQINSGPLLSLKDFTPPNQLMVDMVNRGWIELYYHLPFAFVFYNDAPYLKTYIDQHYSILRSRDLKSANYLFHASYPTKAMIQTGLSESQLIDRFNRQVIDAFKNVEGKILIENLVGSNQHKKPFASPKYIYDNHIVPIRQILGNRVYQCLDTEHLYGSGIQWKSIATDPSLKESIGFIHLNGWPSNVYFGSRVDLHSFSLLKDSWDPAELKDFLIQFDGTPMVFERRIVSCEVADFAYCRYLLDGVKPKFKISIRSNELVENIGDTQFII